VIGEPKRNVISGALLKRSMPRRYRAKEGCNHRGS
jgi:hypothetical protein